MANVLVVSSSHSVVQEKLLMNVKSVLIVEGTANILIMFAKLTVALMTNSAVIMADALHSLADVANNGVALMVAGVSEKPPDQEHPYGHQKFEQLAVFILASFLLIAAFEIIVSAFGRSEEVVEQSFLGLGILLASLTINALLAFWEYYWAKRLSSDLLSADAAHTLSDVCTSSVVIVSWQFAVGGLYWVDSVFAVIVAAMIFYFAFKLFQRAIPVLVDQSALNPMRVSESVNQIQGVESVSRFRSRTVGKTVSADIIVTVDARLTTQESHAVADDIERVLAQDFDVQDVVVHIEPH